MVKVRGDVLIGKTRRTKTGCGNLYTTVNFDNDIPVEVFVRLGKAGGCASSQTEALGRLISLALKNGTTIPDVIKQLTGIGCHLPTFVGGGNRNLSCADAVAKCIRSLCGIVEEPAATPEVKTVVPKQAKTDPCPDCGTGLVMEEGCQKCYSCGYTRC